MNSALEIMISKYNPKNNSYTMITIGIRPVRALYLAIGLAFRKLLGGKLK